MNPKLFEKKSQSDNSVLLEEESQRMAGKLQELKAHMQKEKEKRQLLLSSSSIRENRTKKPEASWSPNETSSSTSASLFSDLSSQPIYQFLQSISLEKYYQNFAENCIQTIPRLQALTEEDLSRLNISLGHRLKILKYSRTFPSEQVSVPPERNPSNEPPKEALQDSSVELSKKQPEVPVFITGEQQEVSIESTMSFTISPKVSCWRCFKIFALSSSYKTVFNYSFCSPACFSAFHRSEFLTCVCGTEFYKKTGISHNKVWYCREECINT